MTNDDINRAQQPWQIMLADLHREYQDRAKPIMDKIVELEAYRAPMPLMIAMCDKCHRILAPGIACPLCSLDRYQRLTVAQLITVLQSMPQDVPVTGYNGQECTDWVTVEGVRLFDDTHGLRNDDGTPYVGKHVDIMGL